MLKTLRDAIILVAIVVLVFLQNWRATLIPLIAVPVAIVGTFVFMAALHFSLNNLSLFGLVLAIGIVVDDAIVVVENVERNIGLGYPPLEATRRAMREVTGPIVATALVLCAVFIPTAFISGLTGQFYKQFAITIAISTVISAFNSLTLSPALCALLLKPHGAKKDWFSRLIDFCFGWFFNLFNRTFKVGANSYGWLVAKSIRYAAVVLIVYGGLIWMTKKQFDAVPEGFIPVQDKQYLVAFAQLPNAASLERSDAVLKRMSEICLKHPGVKDAIGFPGLSIAGFTNSANAGIVFVGLDDFENRRSPELSGKSIQEALQQKFFMEFGDALVLIFQPPPVNGLGAIGGFKMQIQDRASLGYPALYQATQDLMNKARQDPRLTGIFSSFELNVPQLQADVDRLKAKSQQVSLQEVFGTLQVYLGSLYVNDFNRFGRTYQVVVQADGEFRRTPEDIGKLRVRSTTGQMVPISSLVTIKDSFGPDRVQHYNAYPSAEINGGGAPGVSSGEAEAIMASLAAESLPRGLKFEWTDLTYQKILAGNTARFIYPLCLLLVFLVLAVRPQRAPRATASTARSSVTPRSTTCTTRTTSRPWATWCASRNAGR